MQGYHDKLYQILCLCDHCIICYTIKVFTTCEQFCPLLYVLMDAIYQLSKVVGKLWDKMADINEGADELRVHSRVHQRLVEAQLNRVRWRNLVGLVRKDV